MRRAFAFLCILLPCLAQGATVADLYEATVPVAGRSEPARRDAIRAAMRVVLVRVTGQRGAANAPAARDILGRAPQMLEEYGYVRGEEGGAALELRARFDPQALAAALAEAGLALWSRERPSVLVWLAVDHGAEQAMVRRGAEDRYRQALARRARYRGLPITLPLLDELDAARLREAGGSASANVLLASDRYDADTVLIGAVRTTPIGIWEGSWTLHAGGEERTWSTEADLPEAVIDEGVDAVADALAARYARPAGGAGQDVLELRVVDLLEVDQYAAVQRYLDGLDETTAVVPSVVSQGQVVFRVRTRRGAEALQQAIALGDVLEAVRPGLAAAGASYRVLPR